MQINLPFILKLSINVLFKSSEDFLFNIFNRKKSCKIYDFLQIQFLIVSKQRFRELESFRLNYKITFFKSNSIE